MKICDSSSSKRVNFKLSKVSRVMELHHFRFIIMLWVDDAWTSFFSVRLFSGHVLSNFHSDLLNQLKTFRSQQLQFDFQQIQFTVFLVVMIYLQQWLYEYILSYRFKKHDSLFSRKTLTLVLHRESISTNLISCIFYLPVSTLKTDQINSIYLFSVNRIFNFP